MKRWMKKIAALTLTLCLTMSLFSSALAAEQIKLSYALTVNGTSVASVKTGDTITVTFSIKRKDSTEGYRLNAMDNDIEYDKSFFEPVGTVAMEAGGQAVGAFDQRLANHQAIVRVSDMSCSYAAEQTVCTFQLKVIGTTGSSVLRCSEELAYDTSGNTVSVTADNLTVTIGGGIPGDDPAVEIIESAPAFSDVTDPLSY